MAAQGTDKRATQQAKPISTPRGAPPVPNVLPTAPTGQFQLTAQKPPRSPATGVRSPLERAAAAARQAGGIPRTTTAAGPAAPPRAPGGIVPALPVPQGPRFAPLFARGGEPVEQAPVEQAPEPKQYGHYPKDVPPVSQIGHAYRSATDEDIIVGGGYDEKGGDEPNSGKVFTSPDDYGPPDSLIDAKLQQIEDDAWYQRDVMRRQAMARGAGLAGGQSDVIMGTIDAATAEQIMDGKLDYLLEMEKEKMVAYNAELDRQMQYAINTDNLAMQHEIALMKKDTEKQAALMNALFNAGTKAIEELGAKQMSGITKDEFYQDLADAYDNEDLAEIARIYGQLEAHGDYVYYAPLDWGELTDGQRQQVLDAVTNLSNANKLTKYSFREILLKNGIDPDTMEWGYPGIQGLKFAWEEGEEKKEAPPQPA